MKLDRNFNADGRGKYALLLQRRRADIARDHGGLGGLSEAVEAAIKTLVGAGVLDHGDTPESEFFVIRLKDQFAPNALFAYGMAAEINGEPEYARDIIEMANRSAVHPNSKRPD